MRWFRWSVVIVGQQSGLRIGPLLWCRFRHERQARVWCRLMNDAHYSANDQGDAFFEPVEIR